MKPIRLTIKGLNSFIEEQEIDFLQLTRGGFFGIFGPTGSGKSTILDGITIALYGDESRNSADFINVGCDEALISFDFQISGQELKRYRVQRSYKRDKKTNRPRSGKCSLVDITSENPLVLEESVTGINEKCREIIGLTKEDFTRTVVLPQGKFSEFLKMEGKSRRDMLERLFNLQEYGDQLRFKLKKRLDHENAKKISLEGEMKGIGEVTQEVLSKKTEENRLKQEAYQQASEIFEKINQQYEENKAVFQLQSELSDFMAEKMKLEDQRHDYRLKEEELERHKSANALLPYVSQYEKIIKEKNEKQKSYEDISKRFIIAEQEREKCRQQYSIAKERQEKDLPTLITQEQVVQQALDEQTELEKITKAINALTEEKNELTEQIQAHQKNKESLLNKIDTLEQHIEKHEKDLIALRVAAHFKEGVAQGVQLTSSLEQLKTSIEKLNHHGLSLKEELQQYDIEEKELNIKKNDIEAELKDFQSSLADQKANHPGTMQDISNYKVYILEVKQKWEKYSRLNLSIQEAKDNNEMRLLQNKDWDESVQKIKQALDTITRDIEVIQTDNMAKLLREHLTTGSPCPVCGSTEHHDMKPDDTKENQMKPLELLKESKKTKELELKNLEKMINDNRLKIEIAHEDRNTYEEEKALLGTDFLLHTVEEEEQKCQLLSQTIIHYEKEIKNLEDSIQAALMAQTKIEGQLNTTHANIHNLTIQINKDTVDISQKQQQLIETEQQFRKLVEETGITDFVNQSREILEKDKKRELMEAELAQDRIKLRANQGELNTLSENLQQASSQLSEKKIALQHKMEQSKKLNESISQKTNNADDIQKLKVELTAQIKNITSQYKEWAERYDKQVQVYDDLKNKHYSCALSLKDSEKQADDANRELAIKTKEQKFIDLEEVRQYFLSAEAIKNKEMAIAHFHEALSKVMGAIESAEKKLKGRHISEEKWQQLQAQRLETEALIEDLKRETTWLAKELQDMASQFLALKELQATVKNIDHQLALLKDLESLLKGNRFVEFVAVERLKYVSREASERLLEITGNQYGLETDGDGRFLIQDNKNGGILREASTLSGGETFLTSLALALALSAEIQLKGTAPLELFFLDEGFGTLDDNLLDVVMSSLEKIHHDKLKVGIISHVESVKNRVPVKLMVKEAIAGERGSQVRIELN